MNIKDNTDYNTLMKYVIKLLILVIILSLIYWFSIYDLTPKLPVFLQLLLVTMSIIGGSISIMSFKNQTEDRKKTQSIHYSNMIHNKINDIDKLFINQPLLDRLYFEMYSHDPEIQRIMNMYNDIDMDTISPATLKLEHQASNLIFQLITDVCINEDICDISQITPDNIEWINKFRCWMKSPILRKHWHNLQYEQHPKIRSFINECLIKRNKFIH